VVLRRFPFSDQTLIHISAGTELWSQIGKVVIAAWKHISISVTQHYL